jgi:lysozyme family protein
VEEVVNLNFGASLVLVLEHEGGYVFNPHDPGGATCKGVTQAVYDDWRASHSLPSQSVRDIHQSEVEAIYLNRYWDPIRADDLPAGVDYCVFDFGFNSGPNRAARFLQRALSLNEDGQIGPVTIAAAKAHDPAQLIDAICDLRLNFLRALKTFQYFGKGWTRRVAEVREHAKVMVG